MAGRDEIEALQRFPIEETEQEPFRSLVDGKVATRLRRVDDVSESGVRIGELVAIIDNDRCPLVTYAGQPGSSALRARSVVDLHRAHVGKSVALLFENGALTRPIIVGVFRHGLGSPLENQIGQVEADVDGERLVVSAKHQLVLRCGKASMTLTNDGRIEIRGESIVSQASGANRVRGGSVQLN